MSRLFLLIILLLSSVIPSFSVSPVVPTGADSTSVAQLPSYKISTPSLIASGSLMAAGLFIAREDGWLNKHSLQEWRDDIAPDFRTNVDDYTIYLPALSFYALKLCGVESKHSYLRASANLALSYAICVGLYGSLKMAVDCERPNGQNNHSFPSGHTSVAFMTAHFLHKEMGHVSPWISIGAYTCAAASGAMRYFNNAHWVSDILFGAGVGILSAELSFYLSNLLFKQWGNNDRISASITMLPTHPANGFSMRSYSYTDYTPGLSFTYRFR